MSVERITLRGASEVRDIALDNPGLSRGWWVVERDGTAIRRWTDGEAVLPLPAAAGPTMLEIRANSGGMSYVTNAEQRAASHEGDVALIERLRLGHHSLAALSPLGAARWSWL